MAPMCVRAASVIIKPIHGYEETLETILQRWDGNATLKKFRCLRLQFDMIQFSLLYDWVYNPPLDSSNPRLVPS